MFELSQGEVDFHNLEKKCTNSLLPGTNKLYRFVCLSVTKVQIKSYAVTKKLPFNQLDATTSQNDTKVVGTSSHLFRWSEA